MEHLYNAAVAGVAETLVRSGCNRVLTTAHRAAVQVAFERLALSYASLGLSEENFKKACCEGGRHVGKTQAIIDWLVEDPGSVL